ncbi:FMN-dependent oxidoreductase (nitrilotriacetate monooxygenase family) [Lysinibacillus composti]|uniref:LLM class flavin-dependent oxidoreductase n=1 Tax=Lysinibacillus composti TaxID=720633 RepID=A0A3N9UFB9_9BACI|nr:LLM class flavin-dependent oxidoreductase [Lysinibacillus composti]MBM7608563.1 FMN-dependent oxidoreductase (nitrilotriacetate monooxygenase family) [Lysinibacillus composti]RQW74847.1 LLM class flavin-dependent oxidoreductase [Lysinibacillus composti]
MSNEREIKLSLYLIGAGMHVAAWRHPEGQADASIDIKALQKAAQIAEKGKFDIAFVADSLAINHESHPHILNRFDPLIQITALAAATEKIGLGATASTTYSEPYVLARQLMSVDHISNGRVAWNLVTTADATGQTALNFSRDKHVEHDKRYERAEEFADVIQALWNSWEDDAFLYDKEKGIFYDQEKVHEANYKGEHFSIKGPLNIARSPQGHPVIVVAGASKPGQKLSTRVANAVFVHWDSIETAKEHYRSVKTQLAQHGRDENELVVFHGISPVVADTEEEAIQRFNELQNLLDPYKALKFVSGYMGNVDFSKYSLDTPAIEVEYPKVNSIQSNFNELMEIIKRENLKVGDLYSRLFNVGKRDAFVGSAEQVADEMERWFKEKACDGFMLQFPLLPRDLEAFVEKVVPILQERGIYRKDYTGNTLRDHLGLEKRVNQFARTKVTK